MITSRSAIRTRHLSVRIDEETMAAVELHCRLTHRNFRKFVIAALQRQLYVEARQPLEFSMSERSDQLWKDHHRELHDDEVGINLRLIMNRADAERLQDTAQLRGFQLKTLLTKILVDGVSVYLRNAQGLDPILLTEESKSV